MSYILDALRRADSERERGAVPSLNAQPEPLLPEDEAVPPRSGRWTWVAAALGVIAVLGGALVWALTRPEAGPAVVAVAPTVAGAPLAPPAGAAAPSAPAPSLPPLPPEAYAPPPVAARPVPRPAPPGAATGEAAVGQLPMTVPTTAPTNALGSTGAPTAAPVGAPAAATTRPGATGARRAAASAPGDAQAAEPPRLYAQHELPDEVRRGIPALVVNGSVYAKSAADRFLIINGQIVHEKDIVAPDVVLEQIRQRSAVLNSKGFRFEITY